QGDGRILAEGDCLPCAEAGAACPWDASVPWCFQPDYRQQRPLRVLLGGDAAAFDAASRQAFFASAWRISPRSDRMGVRLAG
ncbi:TPA: allophanate hydrolase, partial [Escherichia coli]|nr:allophanate hydrolase [Escherichia coli]